MSESSQDKTEQPSQQKLRKAREEGNVARSKELVTAIMMIVSAILLMAFSHAFSDMMVNISQITFRLDRETVFDPNSMVRILVQSTVSMLSALTPMLAWLFLVTIFANLLKGGWNVAMQAMQPKLSKLNPLSGIKKMFSTKSLVELIKSIIKVTLVGGALYALLSHYYTPLMQLQRMPLAQAIPQAIEILWMGLFSFGLVLLLIAVLEMPYASWDHLKQLKMTKQEVKEEHKNNEGKPEVKAKIRQLQRQFSQRQMMKNVPTADVIITNPTHYAVAIKYDTKHANAPYVVAKGVDQMALHIQSIAKAHEVPIVETPPLARSVYYSTDEWQEVPAALYVAVAHILTYVFQLEQYRQGRQSHQPMLPPITIPDELKR